MAASSTIEVGVGVHKAIWIGAFGSGLPFLFVLVSPARSLRTMPEPLAEPHSIAWRAC